MASFYEDYRRDYAKKNPEKVKRWRYNTFKNFCDRYEAEHPEVLAERQQRKAGAQ